MKRLKALLSFLCGAACSIQLSACAAVGYTVYPSFSAFSDDILFSAKIIGARGDYAYNRMCDVIRKIDSEVSLTRANSDLSRFNAADSGERLEVGEYTYRIFTAALGYYDSTGGAFNCAASPLSELWHLDAASLSEISESHFYSGELPTPDEVAETLEYCDPHLVSATEAGGKYYLEKTDGRVKLDFGGIAKGFAVDECVAVLDEYGVSSALLDISGNAYFYGSYNGNADWNVGIVSPRPVVSLSRGYVAAFTTTGDTSAVTSGDYMRYYTTESGVFVTHIIGRDGVPIGLEYGADGWVNTSDRVISATVIGRSSAMCDALSTAVAVCGIDGGAELLQNVGCKGLIFTEKWFTIIGNVALYKPDEYNGYTAYEYYEL